MWGLIGLLNIGLAVALLYAWSKRSGFGDQVENAGEQNKIPFDRERKLRFVNGYNAVFYHQNLQTLLDICTDLFFHTTALFVRGLNRIGVRRELSFEPTIKEDDDEAVVFYDGKNYSTSYIMAGRYCERYIDTTTGNLLFANDRPHANITFFLTRSGQRQPAEETHCLNCGNLMQTAGELFICRYCGTTYTADSYDWRCGRMEVHNNNADHPAIKVFVAALLVGVPLMLITGFFAGDNTLMLGLTKLINGVFAAAWLCLLGVAVHFSKAITQVKKFDPLASNQLIQRRYEYLLRVMLNAHDYDVASAKPFMSPDCYTGFAAVPHSGSYVLDVLSVSPLSNLSFRVENGYQMFDVNMDAKLAVLTPQRQVQTVRRRIRFGMYRYQHARYQHKLQSESMVCAGCGSSINMTADGRCKFCGAEYDIAHFDWKLGYVDPGSFV